MDKHISSYLPPLPRVVKRKKPVQPFLIERKPDYELVKQGRCGLCGTLMRWDRNGKVIRCRSKKSRDDFFITQEGYENLLNGKTLEAYRDHVKMMGR